MSVTPQTSTLTKIRSKQIIDLIQSGKRSDGRDLLNYREIKIEKDVIQKAEGSASVDIGKTKVLVGVKVDVGPPYPDTPNNGVLTVNSEFVPLAHERFEPGPPDENSIELARVVDRSIRESQAVDVEKLVIVPNEKVYVIFVDIYILNHGGNLVGASELAALTALLNTKIPKCKVTEDGKVEKTTEYIPLPVRDCPIAISFAKVGDAILVDPDLEEEQIAEAWMTITLTDDNKICAIQKSGIGTFTSEEILKIMENSKEKAAELRDKFFKK
jgi:exosome complex component RRP42